MSQSTGAAPYWRLSGFYFFYFASLGALVPSMSPYLKSLSYTPTQIGILIGITMATKVIAPNIWGWIADHTGKRMAIVRGGCLFAAVIFVGIFFNQSFVWLAIIFGAFSFFWNAALPQFEATTFNHLTQEEHRYSSIRLWGSIGFILTVVGLGYVFEYLSISLFPWIVLSLLVAIWLSSLIVPESAAGHLPLEHESLRKVLRKPHVAGLLFACFCMQASHGPYYAVYSIYMQSYGYSSHLTGWLWGIGVIAEVVMLLFMQRLFKRVSLRALLIFSLWVACARWILIALFPQHLWVMLIAQAMHAVTFGVYHVTAIQMIHHLFTGRHQGRGQALYSSLSFGAGGAIGSVYSGFAWDYFGRSWVFGLSVAFAMLGLWVAYRYVKIEPATTNTA